ncbi:MAG: acyl-CoA dehydrogenase family protein [Clostridia bacterium]|nr:acyl-CoA dehydrogenase family protein [Clostridia bacterium]
MLGPTLMQYGTEAQKRRFLPKILSAEEIWCQGYSEPNAGSDLASLRTRGTIQGNKIIINGHKIWTTYAQYADWCFLLCRTDPDAPKHMGITFVLVNMRQPGVTVKPLRQITGDAEFNEIFFDNVEADVENVVGEINGGWKVAMALLGHERGTVYITRSMQSRQDVERLIRLARQVPRNGRPASEDPVIRQRLMEVYADMEGFRWLVYGYVTQLLRTGAPGPESSMLKLFWSEAYQRLTELAVEILGPSGQLMKGAPRAYASGQWTYDFLYSKMRTIAGGTSEIQRNVIGERVLGLPR